MCNHHTIIFVHLFTHRNIFSYSINPLPNFADMCLHSMVVPVSAGTLMALVGIATFIAGVVMLIRAKRVLHHSSQPPPSGTEPYEMGVKRAPLGAGVYEEVDKQDAQTDGHTKHYQELDLAKMKECKYASIKV